MRDYSVQNKKAWEFDAYSFWVEHSGTPEERAAEDVKDPIRMLRKYAQYFDSYEGVKIANICGSCGKKAIPLALLGADVTVFDISEDNQTENTKISNPRSLELTTERLIDYFTLGSTISATAMDYGAKHSIVNHAIKSKKTYLLIETLDTKIVAKPFDSIKTEDKGMIIKLLILPERKDVLLPLSSFYRVTSLEVFSSH